MIYRPWIRGPELHVTKKYFLVPNPRSALPLVPGSSTAGGKGWIQKLESLGATISKTFTESITHVVWGKGKAETARKIAAAQVKGSEVVVVSVLWVKACVDNSARIDVTNYEINLGKSASSSEKVRVSDGPLNAAAPLPLPPPLPHPHRLLTKLFLRLYFGDRGSRREHGSELPVLIVDAFLPTRPMHASSLATSSRRVSAQCRPGRSTNRSPRASSMKKKRGIRSPNRRRKSAASPPAL